MTRKGFAPIVIIIAFAIIGIVALGAAYFYLGNRSSHDQSIPANPSVTTPVVQPEVNHAGWQTFADNDSQFSLLYPPDYSVQTSTAFGTTIVDINSNSIPHPPLTLINLISITRFPPCTAPLQVVFNNFVGTLEAVHEVFPTSTLIYATSTALIGGKFSAQAVYASGTLNEAMYAFAGTQGQLYQALVHYDLGTSLTSTVPSPDEDTYKATAQKILDTFTEVIASTTFEKNGLEHRDCTTQLSNIYVREHADLKMFQLALNLYHQDHGQYPTALSAKALIPMYLDSYPSGHETIPLDPVTGKSYQYKVISNGKDFEICAMQEDKTSYCVNQSSSYTK